MLSIWQQRSFYFPTDIAIIGAGLTGLITAIRIREKSPHTSVRILEKSPYPAGASVKNAGFACFGSVSEILDDIQRENKNAALYRVQQRYQGLRSLMELTDGADIGYRADNGYEVFTGSEKEIYRQSLDSIEDLNRTLAPKLGFEPFSQTDNQFGFKALEKLILIRGEASLNSGKLVKTLLEKARQLGVELSFGSEVTSVENSGDQWKLETPGGTFRAGRIVLATNGFTQSLLPDLPVLPYRGQVLLTSPIEGLNLKGNFHLNQGYFYFRPYKGGVMLGGGRHLDRENEHTVEQVVTEKIQSALEELLQKVIIPGKKYSITKRWAGTLAYGPENEKEPVLNEVQPGMFVAARLGGMGIAMAPRVSAKLVQMLFS